MTEKLKSIAWVLVGWIAFGIGHLLHDPLAKLLLLATARALP